MKSILNALLERISPSLDGEYVGWKHQPGPLGGRPWPDNGTRGPKFEFWFANKAVVLESGHIAHRRVIARRLFLRGMFYDLAWEYREINDPWVAQVNGKLRVAA